MRVETRAWREGEWLSADGHFGVGELVSFVNRNNEEIDYGSVVVAVESKKAYVSRDETRSYTGERATLPSVVSNEKFFL